MSPWLIVLCSSEHQIDNSSGMQLLLTQMSLAKVFPLSTLLLTTIQSEVCKDFCCCTKIWVLMARVASKHVTAKDTVRLASSDRRIAITVVVCLTWIACDGLEPTEQACYDAMLCMSL